MAHHRLDGRFTIRKVAIHRNSFAFGLETSQTYLGTGVSVSISSTNRARGI